MDGPLRRRRVGQGRGDDVVVRALGVDLEQVDLADAARREERRQRHAARGDGREDARRDVGPVRRVRRVAHAEVLRPGADGGLVGDHERPRAVRGADHRVLDGARRRPGQRGREARHGLDAEARPAARPLEVERERVEVRDADLDVVARLAPRRGLGRRRAVPRVQERLARGDRVVLVEDVGRHLPRRGAGRRRRVAATVERGAPRVMQRRRPVPREERVDAVVQPEAVRLVDGELPAPHDGEVAVRRRERLDRRRRVVDDRLPRRPGAAHVPGRELLHAALHERRVARRGGKRQQQQRQQHPSSCVEFYTAITFRAASASWSA